MQTFKASDGVGIGYGIFGLRDSRPPVVLHHGFAASTELNWVVPGIVSALTEAGRWVVAIDARGHGCSEKPKDPARYGEATMARDVLDLVRLTELSSYDLVGYSMGAVVALLVAAADPRVRRLIVGGLGVGAIEQGGVDRRVLPPDVVIAALESEDPEAIEHPMARQFRSFADASGADRFALAAQARAVHDTGVALHRIQAPTLVIAGESDDLAAAPEVLARAIPQAQLARVSGDHISAIFDPRFREAVVSFLLPN